MKLFLTVLLFSIGPTLCLSDTTFNDNILSGTVSVTPALGQDGTFCCSTINAVTDAGTLNIQFNPANDWYVTAAGVTFHSLTFVNEAGATIVQNGTTYVVQYYTTSFDNINGSVDTVPDAFTTPASSGQFTVPFNVSFQLSQNSRSDDPNAAVTTFNVSGSGNMTVNIQYEPCSTYYINCDGDFPYITESGVFTSSAECSPEPATAGVMLFGCVAMAAVLHRRRRRA